MMPAIRASGVGKQYELGTRRRLDPNRTLREALTESTTRVLRAAGRRLRGTRDHCDDGEFWALRDLSLEVARGEAIGIIGGNGAGKSTLLKLLSRITAPTTGRIELRGRVGSLLEVGTGFHPDLTGRDNIYLNGAILGMRRSEITRRFDEIVAFAEVDRFVDTPVKRYSSGMYLRLAFAVAAHLEPEVLLVDEVLAVGDAAFQQKCLGKMGDVTAQGRTVLFVSHNLDAVQRLCARSVLLHAGRLVDEGPSADVVRAYLSHALRNPEPGEWVDVSHLPRHGSGEARFVAVQFASGTELLGGYPHTHGPLEFLLDVVSDAARRISSLAVVMRDQSGVNLVNADIAAHGESIRLAPGHNVVRLEIDALFLNPGEYSVDLWVGEAGGSGFDHVERAFQIRVLDPRPVGTGATPAVTGLVPCGVRAHVQRSDGVTPPDAAH